MSKTVSIICPACRTPFLVDDDDVFQVATCPQCGAVSDYDCDADPQEIPAKED